MRKIKDRLHEETLSTSYFYRGRIINVRQDRVKISGGQVAFREIVEHPGAVAMLVLDGIGGVVLVKQHRQPVGEILLEIPAGKLEPDEEPLQCAQRELLEETGLEGKRWKELFAFYPSPGFCDEIIHLFQVEDLEAAVSPTADPEERISVVKLPLAEIPAMIKAGQIKDGKTIIALQAAMLSGI
ncbi:MAG: NUDIX hydrolase [Bacillota bacterium]